ncbi:endonuclease/exonuclease/phosphatase family protein [uncultured Friedmanniella sp.]|uniref:endonuclease/exonuclease/phosphatase family protein n=1 Tax=uncultured Friedmanniella sp. TaxID=335381 RepID=UPI0035CCA507
MAQGRGLVGALAAGLVGLLLLPSACGSDDHGTTSDPTTVRVLTRNLYLGGDITRPVRAAQGRTGVAALEALGRADAELRTVVEQTDFRVRAGLLAAEIVQGRPDLVGLQEVALWRHGPLQLDHPGRLDATDVDLDFLALLQGELTSRGATYDVVATQDESDVEAPALGDGDDRDLRLTMRDVLLVRAGSAVQVTGRGLGQYQPRLKVDLGGVPFAFVRGYVWADVSVDGHPLRVVSTQLESQSADLALAQAKELLSGPAAPGDRPVVLGCDCNSDPTDSTLAAGASVPGSAAYGLLTAGGLADAWLGAPRRSGTGDTCCRDERLRSGAGLDRRLDLVLSRGTADAPVTAEEVQLVGADPVDRDAGTGLWPSDHAGVLAQLRLG